ncbi:unnamed protein product [Brachionus calyciflorus]|uniref:EF-hand domain-containing protein n=2 Tax=Brachionus calyciflorus TaxID=104777 RepID=A0A813PT92_9BILA|nr:unnamed protein product [Brachionus calyciflorus]
MDWNDPEIFQLCHDFTDHDNLITSNQTNSNFNEQFLLNLNQNDNQHTYIQQNQQRTCDPLMNASDNFLSWDILEPDYNQIMGGYLQKGFLSTYYLIMSVMADTQPLHLPRIVHPSSRVDKDPNNLNVTARGVSRASSLGELADRYYNTNHPIRPYETSEDAFKKSKAKKESAFDSYEYNIPENVKAVYSTDPNKISMPVFGSRPGSSASSISSFRSVNASQAVDIDEYYSFIKNKSKSNFHEIKMKFRNADPDGKGGVSREAFAHILASILGPSKPLSQHHFLRLVEKMGLPKTSLIKYEEFVSCLKENRTTSESSDWLDSARSTNSPITRKATQVFVILKEKSKLKTNDMVRVIPQLNGGSPGRVFKFELMNAINGMGIKMELEEFDKLWKKFDQDGTGFVKSEVFLKRLGIDLDTLKDDSMSNLNDLFKEDDPYHLNIPHPIMSDMPVNKYKVKGPKQKKNPIEKWLKKKFRNGFSKIKQSFEELDLQKTGEVRRDQFLNVLRQHGFPIENNLLDEFLERCGIRIPKNSVLISYVDFLEKFQNRSDRGIAYRFITSGDMDDDKSVSTIGKVERNLLRLFQNDFLALLQIFRKIDRNKTNTISKQEFRAAIESHFSIELTDSEFEEFVKEVPKDSDSIKYLDFMTKFDTDTSSTLFDAQSIGADEYKPRISKKREYEPILEENEDLEAPLQIKNYTGRKYKELYNIIKIAIRDRYKDVENAWSEVDTTNSNEMNKDMMYNLFRKLKLEPSITRDEIEVLWREFILKDNKKLEYWQFVRHFGYSKKSAAFQNSKIAPPKRGDNDMMLTSNKLGRDSILIRGSVQAKLILQFEILKRSFKEIDPYGTNYLLRDEFEEILRELCPELNNQEMDFIFAKYANPDGDGRINYKEFLTPYNPKKKREPPADNLKKTENLPSSRLDMNDPFIIKLRMKLSENYKDLRREFKKHDSNQSGFVNISGFKESLKYLKVNFNEDDMYTLMRRLDKDVTGMINYNKFINEFLKP